MICITELADSSEPKVNGLLIEAAGVRVLVDPGRPPVGQYSLPPAIAASERLDAVVLTHAHADHCAGLSAVVAAHPSVPVLATPSTIAFLQLPGRFTEATLDHAHAMPFDEQYSLEPTLHGPAWVIRFLPAGHMLGAAMVVCKTPDGCIVCSGDVDLAPQYTVRHVARPRHPTDVLVLESTHGDRVFRPRALEEARLVGQARKALAQGGHVLLAVSPLGTAQEVLMTLVQARLDGQLDGAIWVDGVVGPINRVYAEYAPLDYPRLARWIADHGNPFLPDGGLVSVVEPHQRAAMLDGPPAIIVTSASDCRSGPSRHYASALAGNRKHLILVPAGRAAKQVVAQAVAPRTVNCGIGSYGITTHANGEALAALAARWRPGVVVINHGRPEVKAALQTRLVANGLHAVVAAAGQAICWPAAAT